ncbi:hypothetical protein JL39_12785 [Rhizobium sp. YS-1r]|nr:hypothetical protein JL39_12785 [Rhizobium sp. YS-1r]
MIETVESGDTGGLDLVVPAVSLGKPALRSATSQKTGCFEQRAYTDFWADGKGRGELPPDGRRICVTSCDHGLVFGEM